MEWSIRGGGGGLALAVLALCVSCKIQSAETKTNVGEPFKPAVIVGADPNAPVRDYQASANVYYSNDRIAGSERLFQRYKLSTRIIDGAINTRIDYPDGGSGPVSVIVSPEETICFSPNTGNIISRQPTAANLAQRSSGISAGYSLFGKIDIVSLTAEFRALGYDIATDSANTKAMAVNLPKNLIPRPAGAVNASLSYIIYLDVEAGTYIGTESVEGKADGTLITTQITNLYDTRSGVNVPIGTVKTVKTDIPGSIDVSDSLLPPLGDVETVRTLSEKEAADLVAGGQAITVAEPVLGDPSDPDYTETYVTAYEEVKVNTLDDAYFRVGNVR